MCVSPNHLPAHKVLSCYDLQCYAFNKLQRAIWAGNVSYRIINNEPLNPCPPTCSPLQLALLQVTVAPQDYIEVLRLYYISLEA